MMKKLIFVFGLMIYGFGFAQNAEVKGSVLDGESNKEPLGFAKISIKNTSQVVDTDLLGNYILSLKPGNYTLVYEFTGYEPVEVENIVVKNKNLHLKEVVLSARKIIFENNIASKG